MAVAGDALLVADRLVQGLAQSDTNVLDRVMGVDMQVAVGLNAQVDQSMARDLVQHVVEERQAGGKPGHPGTVEVDVDADGRLSRLAGNAGSAGLHRASRFGGRQG